MELQADILLDVCSEEEAGDSIESVCDLLDGRKLCRTNRVRCLNPELSGSKKIVDLNSLDRKTNVASVGNLCSRNYAMDRLNHLNGSKTSVADISDAVNSMTGVSDGGKRCDSGDEDSVNKGSSGRKRKRESMSEMLHWILDRAENPCDPAMGSMPEKSKWKSYGSEEIWKQALLFREAVFLKSDHPSWQGQRMHPCMYDDQVGANYNLRERLKTDKKSTSGDGSSHAGGTEGGSERSPTPHSSAEKWSLDVPATVPIPIGPAHQAEVPEWTGMAVESDSKWFGNQIWPAAKVNTNLIERDPIGAGRKDSCGCQFQGSVECIQFHVAQKRAKLKLELGDTFYMWNLHKTGEDVRRLWTEQEEKKFKDVVKANPLSHETCFWEQLFKSFPTKSREDLVSYYFNVFLLQRRGYQNRNTPNDINSDDDEAEYGPLKNAFGHNTDNPRTTLLSPKKPKTKGR
ncbi:AT-rich interactive domain-containing protein 1 isoform X1 [Arachis hypogaea]|uniref:AT-rich interactive domain-containing protein 1 isoform X1 n=1 Tax=Arachis hypogaea TaxID=3818 RepID=UPI000DEC6FA5|nr:AT-rich interactive domain-containing protein 1 isoform X1 [Arachis hypogaea]XP_025649452.1 AT-rich interactive domain-containing protein 1 isoform X1 [Arachis hypogaea]XP_025649453.1 AT-rich interactive domain-containing protein 1 isoform X1 [Arachis hypogaea]